MRLAVFNISLGPYRGGALKMREWKNGSGNIGTKERENADDENGGVEKSARFCSGRKCGSGNIGTVLQEWKMRELKLSNCNNKIN